jgi:putative sugar O-methyltransferase
MSAVTAQPVDSGGDLPVLQDPTFQAMVSEIEASSDLFRPSKFWDHLNAINKSWLNDLGLETFKRTVAQNYYNWLIVSHRDPQFRSVLRRWLRQPTVRPLLASLDVPDLLRTTNGLEKTFGLYAQTIYRLFVSLLWEAAVADDALGLTDQLSEPSLGRPINVWQEGRRISQDLANSIRECNAIARALPALANGGAKIAELGAGYGRLGYVLLSLARVRYFVFDIPPALHLSQWYLARLFPDRKIFRFRHFDSFEEVRTALDEAEIAFLTPNQLALMPPEYFNVFVSISTLPEMSIPQIDNYLRLMARATAKVIYLKQWRRWRNDKDDFEFDHKRLNFPEPWILTLDRPDDVQPNFQERAWIRAEADGRRSSNGERGA